MKNMKIHRIAMCFMHACKMRLQIRKSFKNNLVLFAVEKADFLCSSQVKYSCIFRNSRVISDVGDLGLTFS